MAFEIGNRYAQEWTLENALPRFEDVLKYALEDEKCLSMQDAIIQSGIPSTTFYYLVENQPVLKSIKEDIHAAIISRINRIALDRISPCPASPAIWRMKQLGERDEQHITTTGSTKTEITVSSKEAQAEVNKLIDKFEKE